MGGLIYTNTGTDLNIIILLLQVAICLMYYIIKQSWDVASLATRHIEVHGDMDPLVGYRRA